MGPRNRFFLRKDAFVLEDQVKNPVSLSECVSPVLLIRVWLTPMVLINCVLLWQVLAKLVYRPLFPYSGQPHSAGGWELGILRSCWLVLATILTKCVRLCRLPFLTLARGCFAQFHFLRLRDICIFRKLLSRW